MAELQRLVRADHQGVARMVVYMGEVDARGLYRELAYSSMFAYAVAELHMSEAEAYLRIGAARVAQRYPVVIELLAQGAVHLSALKQLAPHLTADNHVRLLERARGKTKREVELLVAELAPSPDVPGRMRKLPVRLEGLVAHAGQRMKHGLGLPGPQALGEVQVQGRPAPAGVPGDDRRRDEEGDEARSVERRAAKPARRGR